MTTIFRKLSQKRYWDRTPWLGADDAQADTPRCLKTNENRLSIFVLEEPEVQMERVVAALALSRDSLAHLDLAIAPETVLEVCRIQGDRVQAKTPDSEVNEWHIDLVELTATKIAELARAIKSEGEIKRYNLGDVKEAIRKSLNTNYIVAEQINGKLVQSLEKKGISVPSRNPS